jgi:hypothetical protein
MKKLFVFAIAILGFTAVSFGQASTTANSSANIILPITVLKTADLSFGNIAVGATGGTVIMTPLAARSITGQVKLPDVKGTVTAASFTIGGEGASAYTITLPSSSIIYTSGNAQQMTIDAYTSSLGVSNIGAISGSAGTTGTQVVTVGATLNVSDAQTAGSYSGTFAVTVNYN